MLYKEWKQELVTLQLISQIIGKYKVATAIQEPQWAHVILDINVQGFTTGLLYFNDKSFSLSVNLLKHRIEVTVEEECKHIPLVDGTDIKTYYHEIADFLEQYDITPTINKKPQEMSVTTPLDEDTEHHHYNKEKAEEAFSLMKLAHRAESLFINGLRSRKAKPGLFFGTFDVSCFLVYNEDKPFPDDNKVIERAAFDEPMIEFGFWFGDDKFEGPTFFVLPYPFAEEKFECDHQFPTGSYFDDQMMEYLITLDDVKDAPEEKLQQFFSAAYESFKDYLKWKNCSHYVLPLKMAANHSTQEEI